MADVAELVEQHIRESESRQKHTEELLARARQHIGSGPEHDETRALLERLTQEHARLSSQLRQMKGRTLDDWRKEEIALAGPMAIWDILAQDLEKLVEKLTGH